MDKDNKDFDILKELLSILADKSDGKSESIENKQAQQFADLLEKDEKIKSLISQVAHHEYQFKSRIDKINRKSWDEIWNDNELRNIWCALQNEGMQLALLKTDTNARALEIFYDFVLKEIGSIKAVDQAEAILNEEVDNESKSRK